MKTFLEVGVADFETLLEMAEKGGWTGYCVEPIPFFCESLRRQTEHLPVAVIEAALSDHDGFARMAVGSSRVPNEEWARGASHIIDANHEGFRAMENAHNIALGLKDREIDVQCWTLDTFIDHQCQQKV